MIIPSFITSLNIDIPVLLLVGALIGVLSYMLMSLRVTSTWLIYFLASSLVFLVLLSSAGSISAGAFLGFYSLFPEVTGRVLNRTLSSLQCFLFVSGALLIFGPMHYIGYLGAPRRMFDYPMCYLHTNSVITAGSLLVFISVILFFFISIHHLQCASCLLVVVY
jgi:hypothetical protein